MEEKNVTQCDSTKACLAEGIGGWLFGGYQLATSQLSLEDNEKPNVGTTLLCTFDF
jgi:hypothetical protein